MSLVTSIGEAIKFHCPKKLDFIVDFMNAEFYLTTVEGLQHFFCTGTDFGASGENDHFANRNLQWAAWFTTNLERNLSAETNTLTYSLTCDLLGHADADCGP